MRKKGFTKEETDAFAHTYAQIEDSDMLWDYLDPTNSDEEE